jgi:hypothetical protein
MKIIKVEIKNLKPVSGKYKQGYYTPKNVIKYLGDPMKIIYRSSWEYHFCVYCDQNDFIVNWSSEPIAIPYISPIDNKPHRYYVDFYMCVLKNDAIEKYIVEIKPSSQLLQPVLKTRTAKRLKRFNSDAKTWIVNRSKFQAAQEYARLHGYKFTIVTEKFLFN